MKIDSNNRKYLDILRGASILRVMMVHLGLSWFFVPYSQYINVLLPVFFFVSGAVSFNSVLNSHNRPYYFINRYISLLAPFVIFSMPFLFLTLINSNEFNVYEIAKWLMAYPSRGTYPFDMRQLWFINALILMFLISFPVFKYSKTNLTPLLIVFTLSLLYIPFAEHQNLIDYWKQIDILRKLDIPMQIHQVFSLMNYYFFGAIAYQTLLFTKKTTLIILITSCFLGALILHFEIESFENMNKFFFERNTYFTLISYLVIFLLLAFRDNILKLIDKISIFEWLFIRLSKNSYALFLLHTPVIFMFERYLGFDNLGEQPILALIKMIGVITTSIFIAPYLTNFNNKISKMLTLKSSLNTTEAK